MTEASTRDSGMGETRRSWNREDGQALVEYALILLLIAVVCITVLASLGGQLQDFYQVLADAL